jgi:hypothetical protein
MVLQQNQPVGSDTEAAMAQLRHQRLIVGGEDLRPVVDEDEVVAGSLIN